MVCRLQTFNLTPIATCPLFHFHPSGPSPSLFNSFCETIPQDPPHPFLDGVVLRPPECYGPEWVEKRSAKRDAYAANLQQTRRGMHDGKRCRYEGVGACGVMKLRVDHFQPPTRTPEQLDLAFQELEGE